jgi:predicted glycosyltransferase
MRILVDINHPAHVHLMRPILEEWRARGHECRVTARDKDVTVRLLGGYGIPHQVLGRVRPGRSGRLRELVEREVRFLAVAREFRPQLIAGTTVHAGRVGRLVGAKSMVLNEDDARVVPAFRWISYPLAHAIVTPDCLAYEDYGPRHLTYPSYQELFYLHPNRFTPDPAVLRELGVAPGEPYGLIRLSALDAHHDDGIRGVSRELLQQVIARASGHTRLFVSGEKPLAPELEPLRVAIAPERMHDALALASFVLGDSQTMTAEAAVLGVPAFRINDFVGRLSYLEQLQGYGLAFGFKPGQESQLLRALDEVLAMPDRQQEFGRRREKLLAERIDPLPWFLEKADRLLGIPAAPRPAAAAG